MRIALVMQLMARVLATLGLVFIAVVLPLLELSPTHVFNPFWPPHARFHEVWQLSTNAAVALVGLWLVWRRADVRLAAVLGCLLMGGALLAAGLGRLYGGAIAYEGGPTLEVLGIHVNVLVPTGILVMFLCAYMLESRYLRQSGDGNGADD